MLFLWRRHEKIDSRLSYIWHASLASIIAHLSDEDSLLYSGYSLENFRLAMIFHPRHFGFLTLVWERFWALLLGLHDLDDFLCNQKALLINKRISDNLSWLTLGPDYLGTAGHAGYSLGGHRCLSTRQSLSILVISCLIFLLRNLDCELNAFNGLVVHVTQVRTLFLFRAICRPTFANFQRIQQRIWQTTCRYRAFSTVRRMSFRVGFSLRLVLTLFTMRRYRGWIQDDRLQRLVQCFLDTRHLPGLVSQQPM